MEERFNIKLGTKAWQSGIGDDAFLWVSPTMAS